MFLHSKLSARDSLAYSSKDIEVAQSKQQSNRSSSQNYGTSGRRHLGTGRLTYLDGLRGFAAVLVYVLHYQIFTHTPDRELMEHGWGYDGRYYFAALPFVRLFFTGGHHGVVTFLVISGYVLSYSPLRYIHAKDDAKFIDSLSSALFRRFFRLWIPVAITTLGFLLCWHVLGIKTVHEEKETLAAELQNWFTELTRSGFIYTSKYFNSYNFHVWTIPLEFRGSIVVYTVLMALRQADKSKRLLCQAALIGYFTYIVDGWYCALFLSGMLLCDIDLLAEAGELPNTLSRLTPVPDWIFQVLMIASVYIGGVPCRFEGVEHLRQTPGWYWLSFLKPAVVQDSRWFYRGLAAVLTVVSVPRIAILRSFFESNLCQYLGKISFGFYLVHGPILYTLGDRLYAASGRAADYHATLFPGWVNSLPLPAWGPVGLEINHLAPQLILFPFTIWVADIVTRLVDEPSVEVCRSLQRWLSEESRPSSCSSLGQSV